MYAGASAVGALESLVAGRPTSSPIPIVIAFTFAALLWRYGHRVDRRVLFVLGPIGALLVGGAIATSPPGDGAVMYAWPVLWIASFFGTAETVIVILAVAAAQAGVVLHLPDGSFDRWADVTFSAAVIGAVAGPTSPSRPRSSARWCGHSPPATSGWSGDSPPSRASTR
jgi:hypothetical protein